MTVHINQGTLDTTVSRRSFVKGAAGLSFAFTFGGAFVAKVSNALAADGAKLNAWVTIGTDNTITILCPMAEMGQGVLTSLPLILAEELDADWSKVKTDFAPPNPKDTHYREVEVQVNRPGVTLRYRKGYTATQPADLASATRAYSTSSDSCSFLRRCRHTCCGTNRCRSGSYAGWHAPLNGALDSAASRGR